VIISELSYSTYFQETSVKKGPSKTTTVIQKKSSRLFSKKKNRKDTRQAIQQEATRLIAAKAER
jgi:hypothetical protein